MTTNPVPKVEATSDPEEDSLSDLDDVLDEFDSKPSASGPGRPTTGPAGPPPSALPPPTDSTSAVEDAPSPNIPDQVLASQLQTGMEDLISQLGENPEMQKQFEDMMQELIKAGQAETDEKAAEHVKRASESAPVEPEESVKSAAASGAGAGGHGAGAGKKDDNFNSSIRRTMERMQASGDAATQASTESFSADGATEEEMLLEMMKSLQGGGAGGEGGEEDFNKMLMSMMTQLTNKEILYEPMRELHDKFPAWMEKNAPAGAGGGKGGGEGGGAGGVSKEDLERYKEQQRLVGEIVGRFEREGYSDENEADREFIVERMQKMQASGSPPPDLVGDMSAAQEALGDLDAGCPTQ